MDAWGEAQRAAAHAGVLVRNLTSLADAQDALGVMVETWGEHQLVPREVLRALGESGNVVLGAFRDDRLLGFVLGWFGRDRDGWHLHSHMLAVRPGVRSGGIGYALKLAQRAAVLDTGVGRIRWTFDPLQARNAHFNLAKLGAVADAFHRDFYGGMDDAINAGDRSDRLVVRWDLELSPDVPLPGGTTEAPRSVLLGREGPAEAPRPVFRGGMEPPVAVEIPRGYPAMRESNPALARDWREAVAEAFEACFGAGLIVRAFRRDAAYLLS